MMKYRLSITLPESMDSFDFAPKNNLGTEMSEMNNETSTCHNHTSRLIINQMAALAGPFKHKVAVVSMGKVTARFHAQACLSVLNLSQTSRIRLNIIYIFIDK